MAGSGLHCTAGYLRLGGKGRSIMGQRTSDLPPLSGLPHLVRELRYQEFWRQAIGLVLMPIYALLSAPEPASFWVGVAFIALGTLVRLYASGYIVKNKLLATHGPYSLVRHPLYTGNLLVLIGFTFASGLWWTALVSIAFWWFYYPPAIEYEDRKLHRLFGDEWERWQGTVRAIIPGRLIPAAGAGAWSLRTSLRQNAEPAVLAFVLIWVVVIARRL